MVAAMRLDSSSRSDSDCFRYRLTDRAETSSSCDSAVNGVIGSEMTTMYYRVNLHWSVFTEHGVDQKQVGMLT